MPNWCNIYLELRGQKEQVRIAAARLRPEDLEAGVEELDQPRLFEGEHLAAATVDYPTKDYPRLDAAKEVVARFPGITATMIWYETNMGLRGYAVFQPGRPPVIEQERGLDLCSLPRFFPDHYPCPLGSDAWAADDPAFLFEVREELLLETGQPYRPVREAVTYVPLRIEGMDATANEAGDPQA